MLLMLWALQSASEHCDILIHASILEGEWFMKSKSEEDNKPSILACK
jgi:hypothetical protein